MSNTIYIDANATNSTVLNDSNNRFRYKLPNSMELPTGTEISLQNSIVNLQGITGASVEVPEDINETICFQYYAVDTSYMVPTRNVAFDVNTDTSYELLVDCSKQFNLQHQFGTTYNGAAGFRENIMPLSQQVAKSDENGGEQYTAIPMCGRASIFIKKGVYSISKLAELITRQINYVEAPEEDGQNKTFYQEQKLSNPFGWGGMPVNNTTTRTIKVEEQGTWENYDADRGDVNYWGKITGALSVHDYGEQGVGFSTVAVNQEVNDNIINNAVSGGFGIAHTDSAAVFANIVSSSNADRAYFRGWEKRNSKDNVFDNKIYNLFSLGMPVGTANFNLSYDTVKSGFALDYLHQPRQIPTHDRIGTTLSNAGSMCVYMKRPSGAQKAGMTNDVFNTISSIVQATSGILIYNWAYDTCLDKGDVEFTYTAPNLTDTEKTNLTSYRHFKDFFSSPEKRLNAWKSTIWYKLGFAYTDIQDESSYLQQKWYGNDVEKPRGFTTIQDYDTSIIPSISSIYNSTSIAKGDAEKGGDEIIPLLDTISGIQVFSMFDSNVPQLDFNNNKKVNPTACVIPYTSSFYEAAVMLPVLTKGRNFTASRLPILSTNGYMLILSDLVDPTDVMKNQVHQGLLDVIPKTNLSNQDFVSERNVLTHILSNPKIINEININIVNPDLTDVALEPNSSVLIRITLPTPKPTVFLSNASNNYASNLVENQLQETMKEITSSKAADNLRLDITDVENELLLEVEGVPPEEAEQIVQEQYQDVVLGRHAGGGGSAQQREHETLVVPPQGDPEPAGSSEPPRREEFHARVKESREKAKTARDLVEQLERRRQELRGRPGAIPGRKPNVVRDLNTKIQNLNAEIRKNEEILRRFQTPEQRAAGGAREEPQRPPPRGDEPPPQPPSREI